MPTPTPPKRPHGGKRPGAGAPKGNLNALRTGLHSQRTELAGLIFAAYPELRHLLRALDRAQHNEEAARRQHVLRVAYKAILEDPALANSIKKLIKISLTHTIAELESQPE